jgi:tetratricopeptide (TPR) repeat protein
VASLLVALSRLPLRVARVIAGVVLVVAALDIPASAQTRPSRTPEALVALAESAIEARRYRDAFDAFADAAQQRPRDVSLYVGAAYAASMMGQAADAQLWLERALQIEPRYTPASALLSQVLYRQGKVREAVDVLDIAIKYAPDNTQLVRQRDEWQKDAQLQGRFYESRGAHFSVLFEGPADDVMARKIVDVLEQAYFRIGAQLMTYPSRTITVLLYTQQQFQDITRSPGWTGGVYDGRIKLPVGGALSQGDELQRVVEHEFVHAVISSMAGPTVPTWLHEGLAMTLESGAGDWADDVLARTTTRLPLSALSRGFLGMNAEQAALAYAQSVFAVERMVSLRGMPAVVSLIRALSRGETFDGAFQQAIFMRFEEFEAMVAR